MKRKVSESSQRLFAVVKQLRSKLPRRRRSQFSPIICSDTVNCQSFDGSSSNLTNSFSFGSSRVSVKKQQELQKKRYFTRAYSKKREAENEVSVELSECSCVDSCSVAVGAEVSGNRELSLNSGEVEVENASSKKSREIAKRHEGVVKNKKNEVVLKEVEGTEDSETVAKSEISSISKFQFQQNSTELADNDIVSLNSVQYCNENRGIEVESAAEDVQKHNVATEYDLACSEHFPNDDVLEYFSQSSSYSHSYSSAYSELQSEIFLEWNSSVYTPSTGSQFSEKSDPDTCPSLTFQLFRQFSQQFCRSTIGLESNSSTVNSSLTLIHDYTSDDIILLGLEEEEDEESYRMIRTRERRQVYLHDYATEYCSSTNYGDLVIQQRLQMVHWIVEQATNKELQKETMFLGVNLFDRILSKGYFKTKRNLQIAGIACLTLATRIEENQPYNSIRQKMFYVGSTAYSRSEVVAMEWFVQEILNFQCFLPTMYNFLWFYLKAAKANEVVEKTTRFLAVLVLLGHEQHCYWPSTVAASLVILASIAAQRGASCHPVRETHARQKDDDLPECIKSLEWLVKYIC